MTSNSYTKITARQAKTMMDEQNSFILLDVRSKSEFDEGHIERAVLIPHTEIINRAETELTDKKSNILVYCRSGQRSRTAALLLANLGYTNVYEFGGIMEWPYNIVK